MGKKNKYKIFAGLSLTERVLRQMELRKLDGNSVEPSTPSKFENTSTSESKSGESVKKKQRKRRTTQQDDSVAKSRKVEPRLSTTVDAEKGELKHKEKKKRIDPNASERIKTNDSESGTAKKNLKCEMMEKLIGARFRYINELLYTTTGDEAKEMFTSDPRLFDAYHDGYGKQKSKWPYDPLDNIISQIKKMPKDHVIVDMGCGDARLAVNVKQKVHCFDLIATNERVVAVNMAHVPLHDCSIDVCVFCLSLMGTDLADYICEANRILKKGGIMKIVEIRSRFESIGSFKRSIERLGFQLSRQNKVPDDYFIQMDYEKTASAKKRDAKRLSLKPCLYKKR